MITMINSITIIIMMIISTQALGLAPLVLALPDAELAAVDVRRQVEVLHLMYIYIYIYIYAHTYVVSII